MFEERLNRYLYERAEEARAVRVGEKETSEQAEIVARYADLFSREQHESLRDEEDAAAGDEPERLSRLREACLGGIVVAELAERFDRFENEFLAARVDFRGESLRSEEHTSELQLHSDLVCRLLLEKKKKKKLYTLVTFEQKGGKALSLLKHKK